MGIKDGNEWLAINKWILTIHNHGGTRGLLIRVSGYDALVLASKIDTGLIQFHGSIRGVRIVAGFVLQVDVLPRDVPGQRVPTVYPLVSHFVGVEEPFYD